MQGKSGKVTAMLRGLGFVTLVVGLVLLMAACAPAEGPGQQQEQGATQAPKERFPVLVPLEEQGIKRGGMLVSAHAFDAAHFDVRYSKASGVNNVVGNLYEPLVRLAWPKDDPYAYVLEGALAESWEMSPDAKVWTFKLRQGVKWQNVPPVAGRNLTADDVVWTFNEYRKKDSVVAGDLVDVEKIEAVAKNTVRFTLKRPDPYFAGNLAGATVRFGVLPHDLAEQGDMKTAAIGTGPFILADYVAKSSATFKRNPDYWMMGADGKSLPYMDGYKYLTVVEESQRIAGFRTGQIQLLDYGVAHIDTVEEVLKTNPNTKVILRPAMGPGAGGTLNFKLDKAPWSDVRVRRAMSLAVNRKAMIDTIWKGYGGIRYSVVWPLWADKDPGQLDAMSPWYKYDPEQAKKLLAEAGYPNGIKVATAAPFYRGYGEVYVAMYEQFQADMKKLGVDFQMQERDYTAYANGVYAANFQDFMYSCHCPGAPTIAQTLAIQLHSEKNGGSPMKGFKDPKLDDLINKLQVEKDPVQQKKLAREAIEYEIDQVYRLFMVGTDTFQLAAGSVRNYRPGLAASGPSWPQLSARIWMAQ